MPAAAMAPNVKARMTIAATMPIISLRCDFVVDSWAPIAPPASTWMPALRAGSAPASNFAASSGVSWKPFTLRSTWAMAVLPSALMSVSPAREKGLIMLETWAVFAMSRSEVSMDRLSAACVSLPRETWKTMGLSAFWCGGNSWLRRSEACWASVPGRRMSLFVRMPKSSTPAPTSATTSAQSTSTTYLRRTHSAPRR